MDEAFTQHSRRKSRSSRNLANLSLAPLTSKFPINDLEPTEAAHAPTTPPHSYLEGKSAPTTPRLLSRTPTRTRFSSAQLPKSKSATHLSQPVSRKTERSVVSGTTTPRRKRGSGGSGGDALDGDWFLRTGALMTSEAREYKGQAWLVSRASSTSLAASPASDDEDEDFFDREQEREREFASRLTSRRGSFSHSHSPPGVHPRSRAHSRPGSRTPALERVELEGYFAQIPEVLDDIPGPDFVNLDERLEALGVEPATDDETTVRRLVRRGQAGQDSWLANMLGWSLFSVEEQEESDSEEEMDEIPGLSTSSRSSSVKCLDRLEVLSDERMPPPLEATAWGDAAWLLTVASKVIF